MAPATLNADPPFFSERLGVNGVSKVYPHAGLLTARGTTRGVFRFHYRCSKDPSACLPQVMRCLLSSCEAVILPGRCEVLCQFLNTDNAEIDGKGGGLAGMTRCRL